MSELFKTQPPGLEMNGTPKLSREEILARLEREREIDRLASGLPFLHGWKWYKWARAFYDSREKVNLLCAANQISKSSTQIRKCINWATDKSLWPELWLSKPNQFWYLYPTKSQIDAEFETKWRLFLPAGAYKEDPVFGWRMEKKQGYPYAIHFNSGVTVYFKTYAQDSQALQTGSVYALFADEELPKEIYDELVFRISGVNGYFHMVFTATLGQDFWRRAMEPEEGEQEELAGSFKQTVSLYDAMSYDDGTLSHWTIERIKQVEALCSTASEVLKRVYGKFILLEGRKYESFDIKRHMKPKHPVPKNWFIFEGADPGSGTGRGHPSALCYVAVRPDYRAGRVFLGWRGDGVLTTAGDVVEKAMELKKANGIKTTRQFFDWNAKDFGTIASRMGEPYEAAEKSHEIGEQVLNTLFKNDMLFIYDDPELAKLAGELATLKRSTRKNDAKDDFADALRYAVTKIPWDWSFITATPDLSEETPEKPMNDMQRQIAERRKAFDDDQDREKQRIEDEINEWNELAGSGDYY